MVGHLVMLMLQCTQGSQQSVRAVASDCCCIRSIFHDQPHAQGSTHVTATCGSCHMRTCPLMHPQADSIVIKYRTWPLTLPCQSKHAGCWGNASLSVPNLQDAPAAWVRNKATLCSHQREIPCQSSMASPFLSPTPMLAPVHLEVARVCKSWTKAVAHQPVLLGIVPANLRFGGNTEDGVCSWNA